MEESFTTDGVGHDVDEYINNNISNDEVSNLKSWSHIKNWYLIEKFLFKFHLWYFYNFPIQDGDENPFATTPNASKSAKELGEINGSDLDNDDL